MPPSSNAGPPVTLPELREMKRRGDKIVVVTAYDASFAAAAESAGIDIVLVGDSLGSVVQGHPTTLPVTVDQMVYHTACAARSVSRAWLIADMPFLAARDSATALANARRLIGEGGAAMVKVEGSGWASEVIRALSERDVPVCAHLGLTPQSVHKLGGYRVQGRDEAAAAHIRSAAREVQDAGAELLVLECVPAPLAAEITRDLAIPTIGIGAGIDCDGQVLVVYDLIGLTRGRRPRFVKNFLSGQDSIVAALAAYAGAVRSREFPTAEHSY
ncbi:MAG TPA: 3-methyl-2-oxobutanoate hydroxymethyltransferase [Rhodanobacteraceae bacterium]|jgi:3-methyl-2-oxobutanoate hydroxymethyltransferase